MRQEGEEALIGLILYTETNREHVELLVAVTRARQALILTARNIEVARNYYRFIRNFFIQSGVDIENVIALVK